MLLFFQENWANILIESVGIILTFFIIDRYLISRALAERELPLKRSILLDITSHFDVILSILAGIDLRFHFIYEDTDKQFLKELNSLKEAKPIIGTLSFPSEFREKFFELIYFMDVSQPFLSQLPEYLKYEHELGLANGIKQLFELMEKLKIDLQFKQISNMIGRAQEAIDRIEYYGQKFQDTEREYFKR